MPYVDLNPIRAAIAESLQQSDFTSIQKRVQTLQAVDLPDKAGSRTGRGTVAKPGSEPRSDAHLAPLEINQRRDATGPCCHRHGTRASDKGFLPMPVAAYVQLLEWTARNVGKGKQGATPAKLRPVFERLGVSKMVWLSLVKDFGRLFYAVAGQPDAIDHCRSRKGQRRYKTPRETRKLMSGN